MVQQSISMQLKTSEFQKSIEQDINRLRHSLNTRQKGRIAEEIALKYLQSKGYKLIEKNFFCPGGEIDLIMFDNIQQSYVFIEVKSIQNEKTIAVTQTISKTKVYRLKMSAKKWISAKLKKWCLWRIDFIGIVLDNVSVVHIQSAIW